MNISSFFYISKIKNIGRAGGYREFPTQNRPARIVRLELSLARMLGLLFDAAGFVLAIAIIAVVGGLLLALGLVTAVADALQTQASSTHRFRHSRQLLYAPFTAAQGEHHHENRNNT